MAEEQLGTRESRFRHLYELVEQGRFETYHPGDFSLCKGAIDPHVHCAWNRLDPISQVKWASRAGMRAVVFKIMQFPSVESARITNEAVAEWADQLATEPCLAYGGLVLGRMVGGLNLEVVRYVIRGGGRCIWFPTLTSANHWAKTRQVSWEQGVAAGGDSVLRDGRLVEPAREVLKLAQDAQIAVSFGHASWPEIQELAEECHRLGFRGAMVDHPLNPVVGLDLDQIRQVAEMGVLINFTAVDLQAFVGVAPKEFAQVLEAVGPSRIILSSDAGLRMGPDAVESMRQLVELVTLFGYSERDLRTMIADNAASALGI